MFSENQKISGRQAFRLLTYDLLGLSTLLMPTVLAKVSGRDGIFCIIIGILAGLLYLRLIKVIIKDMKGTFLDYLEQKLGVLVGKIVQIGYLIYFVLLAGYTAYLFSDIVLKNLLREESFWLVLVLILLLSGYGLWGGIEGRARVYELLFWFIMIPLFFMLFSAVNEIEVDYWTPVFSVGAAGIAGGSYYVFLCMALVFLVLFLGSYVVNKETLFHAGKKALVFAGTVHGVLYLILLGIFGAKALSTMDFPAITLMSTVKISGGFLKRADAFMFAIWFFTLYALLNSAAFYGGTVLRQLVRWKDGKKKLWTGERAASVSVLVLALMIAGIFYQSEEVCSDYERFLWYAGTPFLVIMPVILAVLVFFTGNGRRKQFGGGEKGAAVRKKGIRLQDGNGQQDAFDGQEGTGRKNGKRTEITKKNQNRACSIKHMGAIAVVLLATGMLSGCNTAELEDRYFPIEVAVNDTADFAGDWLNEEISGNRVVDYSHLKVIIVSREFLENADAMEEFLNLLEKKSDIPRNTYIVAAENAQDILNLGDALGESVGDYLEELLENVSEVNKKAYPTLGMFYQERENRTETLFLPFLKEEDKKPVIGHYYAWKRGHAAGEVDSETALLSFFTSNEMEDYTISPAEGQFVRLTKARNQISFGGQEKRSIMVDIYCSGEVLYSKQQKEAGFSALEKEVEAYMNDVASKALSEQGIDTADSYKKLGGYQRDWYTEYKERDREFESEMDIVYKVHITWVNL